MKLESDGREKKENLMEDNQMGNAHDDLDKFLKTDGIRIIINSKDMKTKPIEPLTLDGIRIDSINLDVLKPEELRDLMENATELEADLRIKLSELDDFMDKIEERLDDPETAESEDTDAVTERIEKIVWRGNIKGGTSR